MHVLINLISKKMAKDVSAYTVTHAFFLMSPLITLPILTTHLGLSGYGKLAIIIAFATYVNLVIDFGFHHSAARQLAIATSIVDKNKIFWQIQASKCYLLTISLMAAFGTSIILIKDTELAEMIMLSCILIGAGSLFMPTWLYEGIGEFTHLSQSSVITRVIQISLIYILIETPSDIWIAAVIETSYGLICGLFMMPRILQHISRPSKAILLNHRKQIIKAAPFFITRASISLYTTANPIILGLFSSATTVGTFSIAEKIITAAKYSISPLANVAFPRLVKSYATEPRKYLTQIKILAIAYIFIGLTFVIIFANLSENLLKFLVKSNHDNIIDLVLIMSPIPLFVAISNLSAFQILAISARDKVVWKITASISTLSLALSIFFTSSYMATGLAVAITLTELVIAIAFLAPAMMQLKTINSRSL